MLIKGYIYHLTQHNSQVKVLYHQSIVASCNYHKRCHKSKEGSILPILWFDASSALSSLSLSLLSSAVVPVVPVVAAVAAVAAAVAAVAVAVVAVAVAAVSAASS